MTIMIIQEVRSINQILMKIKISLMIHRTRTISISQKMNVKVVKG